MRKTRVRVALVACTIVITLACGLPTDQETTEQPGDTSLEASPTAMPEATATEAPPTPEPPTPEPTQQNEWFDGRVGVSLEATEERRTLPAEYDVAASKEGFTYLCIYLTVTRIEEVHLVNVLGHEREKPAIRGADGQSYELSFGSFKGVKIADPTDIRSAIEFVEGAEGILAFEIPDGTEISDLVFLYSFKESLDDDAPIRGEMIIGLP